MEKTKNLVEYAIRNVPYYSNKFSSIDFSNPEWFDTLPVLKKKDIQNQPDDFISKEFNKQFLLREKTSGSSGSSVLSIYKDNIERIKTDLMLWDVRRKYYKNILNIKTVKFYAYRRKGEELISDSVFYDGKDVNLSLFDLSDEKLLSYVNIIKELDSCWFFAAPSVMIIFANFIKRYNIELRNVVFIELTGEMISKKQEEFISQCFKCPCANYYGSREFWGIAYECRHGNMHIFDKNIKVEVVDELGKNLGYEKEGRFCYTGLEKYAMPLIKYIQGDMGYIKKSDCNCGQMSDILCLSGGRITEYITTHSGKTVNSILLFFIIERINRDGILVLQFQFIQKAIDSFDATIVLADSSIDKDYIKKEMLGLLTKYLKITIQLNVDFVDRVDFNKISSKHKYFINLCDGINSI
jgi:phenylacetate-CoA ligase